MRIRLSVPIGLCVFAALVLVGCDEEDLGFGDGVRGSGNLVTETREVSGFDDLVLLGSGDVIISITGTESLTIEAEDNIMPLLTSRVADGRLELGSTESISPTEGITYTISAATLQDVTINGSGNIAISGLDTPSFEATINGSGDIEPVGTTDELSAAINGSGKFNGADLRARLGTVRVSGSGSAVVNVSENLAVNVSGSGDVDYLGDPTLTQQITGSGSVSQR